MVEVSLELNQHRLQKPLVALYRSLDLESFWRASLELVEAALPFHSCSLLFRIVNYQPRAARHHVAAREKPHYTPATSLSVSRPYLASHPRISLYTYSQIVAADGDAVRRRRAQESVLGGWSEFAHLAFWKAEEPDAVLSVRRGASQPPFTQHELRFLRDLHPVIDAGLFRIRQIAAQSARVCGYEHFLRNLPQPVMFLDPRGRLLFASTQAQHIAARWNSALTMRQCSSPRMPRLPHDLPQVFLDPDCFGVSNWDGCWPLTIRHAVVPGLSMQIDRSETRSAGGIPVDEHGAYVVTFVVPPAAGPTGSTQSPGAITALGRLSRAECRVALLVAEGLRNDEIAERLCRSRRTIEFQLNSIYRKLDLSCRAHLIRALV